MHKQSPDTDQDGDDEGGDDSEGGGEEEEEEHKPEVNVRSSALQYWTDIVRLSVCGLLEA